MMKKNVLFIVCMMMMGAFTVFGQTAVSGNTDSEIATGHKEAPIDRTKVDEVAGQPSQEGATPQLENTVPTAVPIDTEDAASINKVNEASDTKVIISTGKADSGTQTQKDILQPVEKNEPTQRTKRLPFSMHTGLVVSGAAANNMFSVLDFFKPELVIDFNKLSKDTIRSGIHAGVLFNFDWFFQFTVLGEHTVKLSTTVNTDGWGNVSKSLVDLIAKGNTANAKGETINGTLNAKLNAFADTGIMYQLKKPNYGFSARLAYFIPLAYMENPQATFSLSPKNSGNGIDGLTMKAEGTVNIYGYLPAIAGGRELSFAELFKNGGLDLSLAGSYSLTNWVTVSAGVNYLPIMVVQMNTGLQSSFKFEGSADGLLETIIINDKNKELYTPSMTMNKLSDDLPQKKIMRPCKIQIGADFRPFQNNYLILSPSFAFPVINANPYYVDGGLKIESRFAKVLGVYLDTGCIERMWRHELGLFVDSRWFSFQLAASVASQDFKRTFTTLSGVGVKFGIGIGF